MTQYFKYEDPVEPASIIGESLAAEIREVDDALLVPVAPNVCDVVEDSISCGLCERAGRGYQAALVITREPAYLCIQCATDSYTVHSELDRLSHGQANPRTEAEAAVALLQYPRARAEARRLLAGAEDSDPMWSELAGDGPVGPPDVKPSPPDADVQAREDAREDESLTMLGVGDIVTTPHGEQGRIVSILHGQVTVEALVPGLRPQTFPLADMER